MGGKARTYFLSLAHIPNGTGSIFSETLVYPASTHHYKILTQRVPNLENFGSVCISLEGHVHRTLPQNQRRIRGRVKFTSLMCEPGV